MLARKNQHNQNKPISPTPSQNQPRPTVVSQTPAWVLKNWLPPDNINFSPYILALKNKEKLQASRSDTTDSSPITRM